MNDEKKLPAPGLAAFHTRERANDGHKLPLYTPEGVLTSHWLRVRGVDSDDFRRTQTQQRRRQGEIAEIESNDEREAAIEDAKLEMQASLVASWSFEEPCTREAVKELLRQAPQIGDAIDSFATKRARFFRMASAD